MTPNFNGLLQGTLGNSLDLLDPRLRGGEGRLDADAARAV